MINGMLRVAVPPGVGDVYWVLTKLRALRALEGASSVRLYVQQTQYDRSRDWAKMVDFVNYATPMRFRPPRDPSGVAKMIGVDYVLWPNTVVDRGDHLSTWMPHLPLDLNFPVRTHDTGPERRVVVYASIKMASYFWLERRRNTRPSLT